MTNTKLTSRQAAFCRNEQQAQIRQLEALNHLANWHARLDPYFARKVEGFWERIEVAVAAIKDPDSTPIQLVAARAILKYSIPNWQKALPLRVLGRVVNRSDPEVRLWRNQVLDRDGHQCRDCGATSPLAAHHIIRWVDAPELRLILENGLTLCHDCHMRHHHGPLQ